MIPENDTELCMDGYDRIEALEKVVEAADALAVRFAKCSALRSHHSHSQPWLCDACKDEEALAAYEKVRGLK